MEIGRDQRRATIPAAICRRAASRRQGRADHRRLRHVKKGFDGRKSMLTLVAYKVFADVAAKGAMFAITVLAARRLAPEAFGVFAIGATVGWLAALGSDFGMQVHVARETARQPSGARRVLRRWLPIRLGAAAAAAIAIGLLLLATGIGGEYRLALLLFTLTYLAAGCFEFLSFFLRGIERTDLESTLILAGRALTLALAVAVLIWRPDVTWLAIALVVPAASRGETGPSVSAPAASSRANEFGRDLVPLGAAAVLAALYFRVDVLLIDAFKGTAAVGLYNAVFRIVEALRLLPAAVMAVALPTVFRASDARPLLRLAAALTVAAAAISLGLWMSAGWMVPVLFGDRFAEAVPAFRILLMAFPLMALNYALTHQLIGWNRHVAYAVLCGWALAVNVVLNIQLIPAWSIAGAAWATVVTEVVLTIGCIAVLLAHRAAERRSPASLPAPEQQVQPS
jgi:O-antigen/teichoic acid export membrane protein